ncbi:MAG TPA: transglutaminase family protein [Phenylobacterium sp.]|uniref:transglutaminase family protein n=1 Tax=Phenylobacterium sp. TaxID=1871053 RepID=UPI002B48F64F|nr:transglutaminase family protein [Phenylobacterium sp.]HKR90611.1 transglutaminase family protein [Phenylobacterium sp.]
MRIRVRHATTYAYDEPAWGVIQALRVSPSDHDGQQVLNWRVDIDVDGFLRESRDAFGNVLHLFYAEGGVTELTVRVTGEVEVRETAGVVRGAREPFPPQVFLRSTPLTTADAGLSAWADAIVAEDPLARLHRLMAELHARMRFDAGVTKADTPAAAAFAEGHGVCQDYAHIFIAAARRHGVPARYVSGHLSRIEGGDQEAAHAWAEAYVPDLGWTGFDPANGVCADQRYLRVAVGLDYLDAAPLRGARRGGGEERLSVTVVAREPTRQRQD